MALHMPYPADSDMGYAQYYEYGREEGYATGYDLSAWGAIGHDSAFDDPSMAMVGMSSPGMDAFGFAASLGSSSAFDGSDNDASLFGDGAAGAEDYCGLTLGELPAATQESWALDRGTFATAGIDASHVGSSQFMLAASLAKAVAAQRQRQQTQQRLLQQQQESMATATKILKPSPELAAAALRAAGVAGGSLPPGETLRLAAAGISLPKASPFTTAPHWPLPAVRSLAKKTPSAGVTAAVGGASSLGGSGCGRGLGGGLRAMTGPMAAAVAKAAAAAANEKGPNCTAGITSQKNSVVSTVASVAAPTNSAAEGNVNKLPWQIARQVPMDERCKLLMATSTLGEKSAQLPRPELMWEHFSQFGEVSKVLVIPSRGEGGGDQQQAGSPCGRHMTAYVVFADYAALELAKAHGEQHIIAQGRVQVRPLHQAEKTSSSETLLPPGLEMFASSGTFKQLEETRSSPRAARGATTFFSEEASSAAADEEGHSSGSTAAEPAAEPAPSLGSSEGGGEDAAL